MKRSVWFVLVAAAMAGCGGGSSQSGSSAPPSGTVGSNTTGFTITISNMAFSPLDLTVPPGATVTVVNKDAMAHSVTSEPAAGDYTPGAPGGLTPFDTGAFTGQKTFTVPANAPAGTVIPYYCKVHLAGMATPDGRITIQPASTPTPAPTSGSTPTPTPAPPPPTAPGY